MMIARWSTPEGPVASGDVLEIDDDGTFRLERFTGGDRVGFFAGQLAAQQLAELNADIEAAKQEPPPDDADFMVADGGELVQTAAGFHSGSGRPRPANDQVLRRMRTFAASLTSQPVAAVEVTMDDNAPTLRLRHLGTDAAHLEGAVVHVVPSSGDARRVDLNGADKRLPSDDSEIAWQHDVPLGDLPPTSYQVHVDFELIGTTEERRARLTISR
jgi:hypothetical protein